MTTSSWLWYHTGVGEHAISFNLADLFECVADAVPSREALVCGRRRLTYAELDGRATRVAHGLADRGVVAGTHVGLLLYNSVEFVEVMLACFKLRAVPVNVNYRYGPVELAYLFDDADLDTVVFHSSLGGAVAAACTGLDRVPTLVTVADNGGGSESIPYDALLQGAAERDFSPRSADDHYLLYTGGTTGLPKGVLWRHEDIFFATLGGGNPGGPPIDHPQQIGETAVVNRAHRVRTFLPAGDPGPAEFTSLSLGPLMHASGQWGALGTLLGGGRVVVYESRSMDLEEVLDLVDRERVSMLTLVGDASGRPLLAALHAHPQRWNLTSLRLLGSGGSILSGDIKDGLLAAFPAALAISEAVGSSEAPVQAVAIATKDGPNPTLRFASRAGATAVFDDDLREIAPGSGRVGRLATRGRSPIGYYKDPTKTARTFVQIDGQRWSLPGDMATVEADGTIRLLGRGAMCINTGGEKVYPEEVEAVVKTYPGVIDAVVVGAPHAAWGEQVVAIVEYAGSAPPALDDLRSHCKGHLAGYKCPRVVLQVDRVQRLDSGKPDYRWAQRAAADAS